ncbi:MAG: hypothetical protein A3C93_03535 [Candidatus Lloydbacteria bacterium RIFCSPHIGHO2_02_FULL_54_17]|uniref:Uncharacterized protein n=1 Tax=Candidatus Lloydbacteria bacterium RIFCSPHIGHO2_02_FULL_54_17 TaxID=1798664 RepID=A0A1G2DE33_9BACT|nr:MAG: hypothetical protein A3C93_03535 [Candidatus Lloydbacteria bacterium RIFCSPHIGHO2_02_FULL_54_17]OGZ16548.1 MAG: hypothetical protein A3H76_01165 [Candidatus Lloydbacteria bacterium RIFCSPLOWO2_02_FULL_54_12]
MKENLIDILFFGLVFVGAGYVLFDAELLWELFWILNLALWLIGLYHVCKWYVDHTDWWRSEPRDL